MLSYEKLIVELYDEVNLAAMFADESDEDFEEEEESEENQ